MESRLSGSLGSGNGVKQMTFEEWYYRNFPLPTTDVALERKRWMKLLWEDAFEEGYKSANKENERLERNKQSEE